MLQRQPRHLLKGAGPAVQWQPPEPWWLHMTLLDVLGLEGSIVGGGELGSGDMTARSVRYSTCIGTLCQFILMFIWGWVKATSWSSLTGDDLRVSFL